MANIIIKNEDRERTTDRIMKQFNIRDKELREAAELIGVRQEEMIKRREGRLNG